MRSSTTPESRPRQREVLIEVYRKGKIIEVYDSAYLNGGWVFLSRNLQIATRSRISGATSSGSVPRQLWKPMVEILPA
jgi:hypothetical protein